MLDPAADRAAKRLQDRLEESRLDYLSALVEIADYAASTLKDDDRGAVLLAKVEDARIRLVSDNIEVADLLHGL